MTSALQTLLTTCAVLLVLIVGGYLYLQKTPVAPASGTATTSVPGIPEGVTVTEVPITKAPIAPDYRKSVAYSASVTADVKAAIEPRFAADVALLAKNPQDFSAWMDLAILHKIGGDYRAAEAIWLYVTKEWPTSPTAFHNLEDLYQNFLH